MIDVMPVASIDKGYAKTNPWGLTAHQCCAMRLVCKHGSIKFVWADLDIPLKTIQHHVEGARQRMGLRGHDIRVYLNWYDFTKKAHLQKATPQAKQPVGCTAGPDHASSDRPRADDQSRTVRPPELGKRKREQRARPVAQDDEGTPATRLYQWLGGGS